MEVETHVDKDCSALGSLFQYIVNDLKGGTPIWEDFLAKASKLHSQLKITASVSAAFLDSFQKVADMATNTKGATKEVGKALTRLCLRHRSVEAKLRSFTTSIMEQLVIPLQDKLEDWKKSTLQLDKDHSKEFKRARQEIKKMSTDTLRLQKKVKKGSGKWEMQRSLECALQEMSDRCLLLEEAEKQAVRRALVEERARYCLLVACLTPVLEEELLMLQETSHLQEILDSLAKLTRNPECLPSASEQVITDLKGSQGTWTFQTPPGSPVHTGGSTSSSLGSRKSSMCSISSFNSSSSGSTKSHSPSHQLRCRTASQPPVGGPLRLSSVSSQDSGFTSQDTLFLRPPSPRGTNIAAQVSGGDTGASSLPGCASSSPSSPFPTTPSVTSTWPNLQDSLQFERAMNSVLRCQRPHTISSAYERSGHQARPLLTAETFQPLEGDLLSSSNHSGSADTLTSTSGDSSDGLDLAAQSALAGGARPKSPQTPTRGPRPPVPIRTTSSTSTAPSLPEKPAVFRQAASAGAVATSSDAQLLNQVTPQPIYANADDLALPSSTLAGTDSPPLPPPPVQESLQAITAWEPDNTMPVRRGSALQAHEAYKTYSPSNASMRYEGLSKSSTLPAKSSFRRGSQPPPPPPVRRTPSITSTHSCSPSSPSSQHFQEQATVDRGGQFVGDNDDGSTSRAKLIQALNARFSNPSPLEQAGLRFSLPSSHTEDGCGLPLPDPPDMSNFDPENDSKPFPAPPPFLESLENELSLDTESEAACTFRKQAQHEKKLLRAHTIGHSERDALIQSLNAKFSTCEATPICETKTAVRKSSFCESSSATCTRLSADAAMKTVKAPPEMEFFRANLEQTLLKRELRRDPRNSAAGGTADSPAENRRSRSVGPVPSGEKKNNSVERRQFLSNLNARLAEQRRVSLQPAQQQAPSAKQVSQYMQQMTTFSTGQTTVPAPVQYVHTATPTQIHNLQAVQSIAGMLPQTSLATTRRGSLQPDVEFGSRQNGGRAARVQSWLAARGSVDLTACRESLMDQIRQGTVLKRVASQSDRSTPLLL
ncbi:protein MTSS 1 isoform X2 [Dermacentor silvarum]|uniref:protein MTSS 1 isoform X2 n=1 Tax=Dermacentor silvarum TaxID=543639 RepID=UPI0018977A90|nr:protein MTSS 1 isoform X2 [Dermacentor silvarum]